METDKLTQEAREALARCYHFLLHLAQDEDEAAADSVLHSQPLDRVQDEDSDSKEVITTNEAA